MNRAMTIRTAAVAVLAAVLLIAGLALVGCGAGDHAANQRYHCPMHPTYVSDKPGDCPICGMRLVPIEKKERASAAGGQKAAASIRQRTERLRRFMLDPPSSCCRVGHNTRREGC